MNPIALDAIVKAADSAKSHLIGSVIAAVTGFIGAESQNFPAGIVVLITLSAGAVGAFFTNLPKIIAARSASQTAALQFGARETEKLIERIHDSYAIEVSAGNRRVHLHQQISEIHRQAKHKALGETQRLAWHIAELEQKLRGHGEAPPHFELKRYDELAGDSDAEIQRLLADAQLEEAQTA